MAREFTISTVSETLTDRASHPVKEFLRECGLDVKSFPNVYFTLEIQEKLLSNTQVYLPLRIPGRSGFIYESAIRVVRVMEIPGIDEEAHRSFIEVEWKVDENPLFEAESHAAFSFVSGEVECPSCRSVFIPEASIIDERSIKINCPSCMHYWTIRVDSPALSKPACLLLTDSFYQNPASLRKEIASWGLQSNPVESTQFKNYFPFEFEAWDKTAALEWFFNDLKGYRKIAGSDGTNFDVVVKSFFNFLALRYFKNHGDKRLGQNLETTDICRKSMLIEKRDNLNKNAVQDFLVSSEPEGAVIEEEIIENQSKEVAVPIEDFELSKISQRSIDEEDAERAFHEQSRPITEVRALSDFVISAPIKHQKINDQVAKRSLMPKMLTAAALGFLFSLFVLGAGFGYFYFEQKGIDSFNLNDSMTKIQNFQDSMIAAKTTEKPLQEVANLESDFQSAKSGPANSVEPQKKEVSTKKEKIEVAGTLSSNKIKEVVTAPKESLVEKKLVTTKQSLPEPKKVLIKKEEVTTASIKTPAKKATPSESIARSAFKEAFFRQGIVYMDLQEYTPAIKEFQKVIEIDSEHILSYAYLGKAFLLEKNYKEALQSFESYLRLNPKQSRERADILEAVSHLKEKVRLSSSR